MITKLEISGFKSFSNFSVDLAPFVVVAGLNGAGKSNFFEALQLLSDLAKMPLRQAFSQQQRGDVIELFTQYPDGEIATQMDFAVEMLVDTSVSDSWGGRAVVEFTRMRYELKIERKPDPRGIEGLFIQHESLSTIPRAIDQWYDAYVGNENTARRHPVNAAAYFFINTRSKKDKTQVQLFLTIGGVTPFVSADLSNMESTMLSVAERINTRNALAARNALRNCLVLQLDPAALSAPSDVYKSEKKITANGKDLSATLYRIKNQDPRIFKDISLELTSLIPSILEIEVAVSPVENKYVLSLKTDDGRSFSSKVFSEGTLRLLALLTLKHDPMQRGVLCFEEPENGVNPMRLVQLCGLLRDMSTNFQADPQVEFPLQQVLINTHSPVLVGEVCRMEGFEKWGMLLFARQVTRISEGKKWKHTVISPVSLNEKQEMFWEKDLHPGLRAVNRVELLQYLETAKFEDTPNES
jgi:predicted ATPase